MNIHKCALCGSYSCLWVLLPQQKYSSRDESKASTSQSLEEISVHNVHFPCSGRVFAALSCSVQYQGFSRTPDISQNLAVKSKRGLGDLAQLARYLLATHFASPSEKHSITWGQLRVN